MYRWTELRNLQEPCIRMVVSCTISSAKENHSNWDNHCEETCKLECFEVFFGRYSEIQLFGSFLFGRYSEIQLGDNGVIGE